MRPGAAFSPEAVPATTVHEIIGIAAGELADLEAAVHGLQDLIGTLVEAIGPALPRQAIVQLQDADSVAQRLTHLAQLMRILRRDAPDAPIAAGQDLADILVRLRGARGAARTRDDLPSTP